MSASIPFQAFGAASMNAHSDKTRPDYHETMKSTKCHVPTRAII